MRIKRPLVCKHSARAGTDLEKHGHEKQGHTLPVLFASATWRADEGRCDAPSGLSEPGILRPEA